MSNKQLGLRLYALRKEANLSQTELADRADLNVAVISRLERGVNKHTRYDTYAKLANALDVPVAYLTDTRGSRESETPLFAIDYRPSPRNIDRTPPLAQAPAEQADPFGLHDLADALRELAAAIHGHRAA